MELMLKKMTMENFKGVRQKREICFGRETTINGRNGLGKTTVADAFFWVLLNKDSRGNAPGTDYFHEKPLDDQGREIHNLDTTVTLECTLDGQPFNLRRTQRENWVKKRGNAEAAYQGNVSAYWLNDVELKVNEFKSRIAGICPEEVFRYIAMLANFNAATPAVRRNILLSMTGAEVDGALLQMEKYAPIADEIISRNVSVDDLKKVLQAAKNRQEQELRMIPVRVDEVSRKMPRFEDYAVSDAKETVENGEARIADLDAQIASEMQEDASSLKGYKLQEVRRRLYDLKEQITREHLENLSRQKSEMARLAREKSNAEGLAHAVQGEVFRLKKAIEGKEQQRQELRLDYHAAYQATYIPEEEAEEVCPHCGQAISEQARIRLNSTAQARFMAQKKKDLTNIQSQGKALSDEIAQLQERMDAEEKVLMEHMQDVKDKAQALEVQRQNLMPVDPDFEASEMYNRLTDELAEMEESKEVKEGGKLDALRQQRKELVEAIDKAKGVLMLYQQGRDLQVRIVELEGEQRKLGDALSRTEQLILLTEEFLRERCSMLEEDINSHFPSVRWKLFNQRINGGIEETCLCQVKGMNSAFESTLVDYTAANTGARLAADLEIISALSEHYETHLPVFFDNRESINDVPPTDAQLITFAVTDDAVLRVEITKD